MGQNKNVAIAAVVVIVLAVALIAWRMFKPAPTATAQPGTVPSGRAMKGMLN
jgi:hypothetical protein